MQYSISTYKLMTLLSKIELGEIRVPAFQRPFVWDRRNILNLLTSMYKGFPIGTIIFIDSPIQLFKFADSKITGFPDVPLKLPVKYIIDGLQRITVMYKCLTWKHLDEINDFNVLFDIDSQQFVHFKNRHAPRNYIHISSILSGQSLMQISHQHLENNTLDMAYKAIGELHNRFGNYEVLITVVDNDNVEEILSIYESVNTNSHKLSQRDLVKSEKLRNKKGFGRFLITKRSDGNYGFTLSANNGQTILTSESFKDKRMAKMIVKSVKVCAGIDDNFERRLASNGQPYFILKASNGEILGRSEVYYSTTGMEEGIRAVKDYAKNAIIEDEAIQ
jgi:uncharacterized protein YegP (UPF0339 family)